MAIKKQLFYGFKCLIMALVSLNANAAWFEASGQAIIHNDNKELARQQATQEALRQALLFAGASVRSVQNMVDGLLYDDRFEIRATGEVASVELIDEVYDGDVVTISIRADIFPQENTCSASDYKKSIVTTLFGLSQKQHATAGGLHNIALPFAEMLRNEFSNYSRYSFISQIEPYVFKPQPEELAMQAVHLAQQSGAQFVLLGEIVGLEVEAQEHNYLDYVTFWETKRPMRRMAVKATLLDGTTGEQLLQHTFSGSGTWQFDLHETVDPNGAKLWQSSFGQTVKKLIQDLAFKIDEKVRCLPSYGRILEVANNQIAANIGSNHGVQRGDEVQVFKMRQFFSPAGIPHFQYQIHPSRLVAVQVFANSVVLRTSDGTPMMNIQPNDFIVRL